MGRRSSGHSSDDGLEFRSDLLSQKQFMNRLVMEIERTFYDVNTTNINAKRHGTNQFSFEPKGDAGIGNSGSTGK